MDPTSPNFPTALAMLAMSTTTGSSWGGGGTFGANAIPLCNVQLPEWMAGPWTLTLGAMQGASSAGGVSVPPDYQVNTDPGKHKVSIEWGVGGARESCLIDYPWAGCIVTLFGANIVVRTAPQAINAALGGAASVSAFLTPGARGANAEHSQPTYTSMCIPDGANEVRTLVPRRARAYRISFYDEDGQSQTVSVFQESARAAVQLCCDRFSGGGNYLTPTFPGGSSPQWTPLMSGCNQLYIQSPVSFWVTYALDLG